MEADEIEPRLSWNDAPFVNRLAIGAINRLQQVDPRESRLEARAPDHVGDIEQPLVGEERLPSRTPVTRGTRSTPAATKSAGFTRISGPPFAMKDGRTLRPMGVATVRIR